MSVSLLLILDSGYFNAAAETSDGVVKRAAPIIKYMVGWSPKRVAEYAEKKKWKLTVLEL